MSSDPRSDAPSPGPELIRDRGAPLLEALEARLPGAREHADATASWALAIAVELGLERQRCLSIRETARLHEIGKLYISRELLARPLNELSAEESTEVERQAEAGADLALGAGIPEQPCAWLRHQRERFDGEGLPDGLGGEGIPLESRTIRTACTFESLLAASTRAEALSNLRNRRGGELDPRAVDALETTIARA